MNYVSRLNQQFPVFSRKQVVEGVGYIQLLSQNLELTNEQMENLANVAGALGVVLGKDVNDAARELALFLSSGYGEALQRAGILASKAAVEHELLRMGIEADYNSVDQDIFRPVISTSIQLLSTVLPQTSPCRFTGRKTSSTLPNARISWMMHEHTAYQAE